MIRCDECDECDAFFGMYAYTRARRAVNRKNPSPSSRSSRFVRSSFSRRHILGSIGSRHLRRYVITSRQGRKVIEVPLTHDGVLVRQHRTKLSARSAAAERMRLYRQRQRCRVRCVTIELGELEINTLVGMGLLRHEMRNNVEVIKHAIYQLLDQALGCDA
jgi:hypothetical protein